MEKKKNIQLILEKLQALGLEYNHKNGGFFLGDLQKYQKVKKVHSNYIFKNQKNDIVEFMTLSSFIDAFNKTANACNIKIFT